MRMVWGAVATVAASAALAACSGGNKAEDAAATPSEAAPAASEALAEIAPPASFAQCMSCHSPKQGVNGVGPSLFGVVGRKAGTVPNFAYSDALKAWGKTLDEATLDQWLSGPMKLVPGTKMVFPGIPDAAKRAEVIAYLKTLK